MTLDKCLRILDKVLEYSLYGLAFFIPISIALVETFTITAIVTFALKTILSRWQSPRPETRGTSFFTPDHVFLLLFFIFCAISLVHSAPYLSKGLNALFGKWGKFILLYGVAAASLGTGNRIRNITLVFLASAALVGIDAYSQKYLGVEFLLRRSMTSVVFAGRTEYAVTGALKHSNNLAAYLICAISLLAGMAAALRRPSVAAKPAGTQKKRPTILSPDWSKGCPSGRQGSSAGILRAPRKTGQAQDDANGFFKNPAMQWFYRVSLVAVILLLTFCLIQTFSRGGWMGLGVAGCLMFFLLPRKKFVVILGVVFILLIFSLPGASERVAASVKAGGDSGRHLLWDGVWLMIAEHPFVGKGVGTFMAFFQDYIQGHGPTYAHNCYLQMWAEIGVFGLLSFLAFLYTVLRGGFVALFRSAGGETGMVLAGLIGGVAAFLTQSALDTNLYSLQPSAMFWLFLGMIAALSRRQDAAGTPPYVVCGMS
jgi:O-antigen ligase